MATSPSLSTTSNSSFVIVLIGVAIGSVAGTWLGILVTKLVWRFFSFSVSGIRQELRISMSLPADLSLGAAIAGRRPRAARRCDACRRPSPCSRRRRRAFGSFCLRRFALDRFVSQPIMMMLRNIAPSSAARVLHDARHGAGDGDTRRIAVHGDTMEQLIDVTYFMADRQDATVSFIEKRASDVVLQMARLPGVLAVEPYRRGARPHPPWQRRAPHDRSAAGRAMLISAGSSMSICGLSCCRKRAWPSRACLRKFLG